MLAGGVMIGLPCAYAVGSFLRTALFGLQPLDLPTHGLAFIALVEVALRMDPRAPSRAHGSGCRVESGSTRNP